MHIMENRRDPLLLAPEQWHDMLEGEFRRAFVELVDMLIGEFGEGAMAQELSFLAAGLSPCGLTTDEMRAIVREHAYWFYPPGLHASAVAAEAARG